MHFGAPGSTHYPSYLWLENTSRSQNLKRSRPPHSIPGALFMGFSLKRSFWCGHNHAQGHWVSPVCTKKTLRMYCVTTVSITNVELIKRVVVPIFLYQRYVTWTIDSQGDEKPKNFVWRDTLSDGHPTASDSFMIVFITMHWTLHWEFWLYTLEAHQWKL